MSTVAVIATVVGISAIVLLFYFGVKLAGKTTSSGATNASVKGAGDDSAFDPDSAGGGDAGGPGVDGGDLGGDGGGLGGDGGGM